MSWFSLQAFKVSRTWPVHPPLPVTWRLARGLPYTYPPWPNTTSLMTTWLTRIASLWHQDVQPPDHHGFTAGDSVLRRPQHAAPELITFRDSQRKPQQQRKPQPQQAGVAFQGQMHRGYKVANRAGNYTHRGKYVEVYSLPISAKYAQVVMETQPVAALPRAFVEEHDGKLVSFTGFEMDLVRTDTEGVEHSVSSHEWYNHHHNTYLLGDSVQCAPRGLQPTAPT
jgi:hypothetical protein